MYGWAGQRLKVYLTEGKIVKEPLSEELEGKAPELHLIGDARGARVDLMPTIHEAYRLAPTI